jgi:dihydroorotase
MPGDVMMPIWLRGGHIIDPANDVDLIGDVIVVDGTIRAVGKAAEVAAHARALEESGQAVRAVDLTEDHIVAPGFVDLHTHLREPGLELRETVRSGARAAAQGGFTTICCMPNTEPVIDDRGVVEWVKALAAEADIRVLPIAAITRGQEGAALTEMVELAEAGAVAFSDDGKPVKNGGMLRLALTYALPTGKPVINHCEDPDLVGQGVMHAGALATRLGLRGWPAAGETVMLARDLELARVTGGRYHAAHLSVAGSVELVRCAKEQGIRVTAEVTPHHLLLTHAWVAGEREGLLGSPHPPTPSPSEMERGRQRSSVIGKRNAISPLSDLPSPPQWGGATSRYDTATKVNPPLRTLADVEALIGGLLDGTIDCIATDHAPHSAVEKECCYDEAAFGISGLETAFGALMALVHAARLPMRRLIAALTAAPARAFALDAGTLGEGHRADVVVIDPHARWVVDPTAFASRGRNTPLAGIELQGRVLMTIYGGRVVYEG